MAEEYNFVSEIIDVPHAYLRFHTTPVVEGHFMTDINGLLNALHNRSIL